MNREAWAIASAWAMAAAVWLGVRMRGAGASTALRRLRGSRRNRMAAGRPALRQPGVAQWESDLMELATAVQAGVSLDEAILSLPGPAWAAYTGLRRAGVSASEALERSVRRLSPPVAAILAIHIRCGGPLAAMLYDLAAAAGQRRLMEAELRAKSGEARASAVLLAGTGPALAAYLLWRAPALLTPLLTDGAGMASALAAILLWAVGVIFLARMLRLSP